MSLRTSDRRAARIEPLELRLLMARVLGVDVSHWNDTITTAEWTSAKNAGFVFAWAKATQGTSFVDNQFVNNETNAKAAGVKIGAYHFAQWDANTGTAGAQAEADHFWTIASPYIKNGGSYLQPMLDIERVTVGGTGGHEPDEFGYTKATFSAWINDFMNRMVSNAAGLHVVPVIYCGTSFSANWIDSTVAQNWPLWRSSWNGQDPQTGAPTTTSPWQTDAWQFWQYSDSGAIPGIGNDDVDVLNGDIDVLQDYIVGSVGRWSDGARVDVTAGSLKAWATSAANTTYTSVANGTVGTILQGPVYGNSYQRWQVRWDNGVVGWCAEDLMNTLPVAPITPSPAHNAVINALPGAFTWAASTGATSYDVYRDGAFQNNVATTSWATIGSWADGLHTWRVNPKNAGATITGTTWNLTLDTTAPTASYGGQTPAAGSNAMDFTVVYTDATTSIDSSSFNTGDVTITGPNGFSQVATFVSATPSGNGTPRTVTYHITAPGGSWNAADNGTYSVTQNATQVKDTAGNNRPAGIIGTFSANSFAWKSGSALVVEFDSSAAAITVSASGANFTVTKGGVSIPLTGITSVAITGTSAADILNYSGTTTAGMALNLGAGSDALNVTSGTFEFNSDAAAPSLTINAGGAVQFNATQHLKGLNLTGGAARLSAGGNKAIVLASLSISGGTLDLANGAMIVSTGGALPIRNLISQGAIFSTFLPPAGKSTALGYAQGDDPAIAALSGSLNGQSFSPTSGTALVRFTYQGDADLDGDVDGIDISYWASNFTGNIGLPVGTTSPSRLWTQGDWDNDGDTDGIDIARWAANFTGSGGGSLGAQSSAASTLQLASTSTAPEKPVVASTPTLAKQPKSPKIRKHH